MTWKIPSRLLRFAVVGASGVLVNMGLLMLLTERAGWPYILASLLAIEASILSNFALNNAWTWSDRKSSPLLHRLVKYHTVAGITAFAVNWLLLVLLTEVFGMDYRLANFFGIGVGVVLNFYLNNAWTFRKVGEEKGAAGGELPGSGALDASFDPLPWVVVVAVALLTGAKVYFAARAELLVEEAYYWTYWQHPALSYFDHPPMVAWVVGVGTALLGDTELGVRLGTLLLSLGSTGLVYLLARVWFGRTCGCWAALLFNLLPIYIGTGLLAFPDGPLIFFWLLTLYAVAKALGADQPESAAGSRGQMLSGATGWWLLAGVGLGGAMLSKYTAIMLVPSLALFLLLSRRHRFWLGRPQPWIASLVALLVFSPVLVWNARHEWASFLFQSTRTAAPKLQSFAEIMEFWGLQIALVSPVVFVLLAVALRRGIRRGWLGQKDEWSFAACFFLPLFLTFVWASFKTDVHVNWTAPAFLSLLVGAAALWQEFSARPGAVSARRWRRVAWTVPVIAFLFMGFTTSMFTAGVPARWTPSRTGGWRELAAVVQAEEKKLQAATGLAPFIIGADRYNLASQIGFYGRQPDECVNNLAFGKRALGFAYWTDLPRFQGRPAVVVLDAVNERALGMLTNHFERLDGLRKVSLRTVGRKTRDVWVVNGFGYRPAARLAGAP